MTTGRLAGMLAAADARRAASRRRDAAVAAVTGPLVAPDGQRYARLSRLQRRLLAHLYAQHLFWESGTLGTPGPGRTYDPGAGGHLWQPSQLLGQELETAEATEARVGSDRERPWRRDSLGRLRREARGSRLATAGRTAASRALLRLVDRGLVERRRSGGRGGQRTYVRLTPDGRALAELLLERAGGPPKGATPTPA